MITELITWAKEELCTRCNTSLMNEVAGINVEYNVKIMVPLAMQNLIKRSSTYQYFDLDRE